MERFRKDFVFSWFCHVWFIFYVWRFASYVFSISHFFFFYSSSLLTTIFYSYLSPFFSFCFTSTLYRDSFKPYFFIHFFIYFRLCVLINICRVCYCKYIWPWELCPSLCPILSAQNPNKKKKMREMSRCPIECDERSVVCFASDRAFVFFQLWMCTRPHDKHCGSHTCTASPFSLCWHACHSWRIKQHVEHKQTQLATWIQQQLCKCIRQQTSALQLAVESCWWE